jgi:hypothetical protein
MPGPGLVSRPFFFLIESVYFRGNTKGIVENRRKPRRFVVPGTTPAFIPARMSDFDSTAFPVRPVTAASAETAPRSNPKHAQPATATLVWSWFIVVAAALFGFKLILLAGQGENLYEAHWRIGGLRITWVNDLAWYVFVVLGTLGVLRLGTCCQLIGVKAVRVVNATVVILGLCFVFLTFHNGDKNYLYPLLSGVLHWTSVGPYLANSLFFNQPFLAAWVFAYAVGYYLLVRSGREKNAIMMTAAFGLAYGLINLGGLKVYRHELLIIDCLGCVSLLMAWRSSTQGGPPVRLSARWSCWPIAWTILFGWALMRFDTQWHSNAANYFLGLIGFVILAFATAGFLVRKVGNPVAWSWLAPFFLAGFFLLADSNYPASVNYSHLLCLGFTFPRYIAGDLVLVGLVALCALVYRKLRPRGNLWWLNVIGLGLIIVAGVDLRLSQIMGVRLGWDVLSFGDSPKMMFRMAKPYLPGALLGFCMVAALYALALRAVRTWAARNSGQEISVSVPCTSGELELARHSAGKFGLAYLTALFGGLGLLGFFIAESDKVEAQPVVRLVRTSPLWKHVANRALSPQEFVKSAEALGLGDFRAKPAVDPVAPPRDLNVLVVFMESSYNKHLSLFGSDEETQPLLSNYKERMELFPNFFSAFTGSIHARFATFTSLYPALDFHTFTQERVPVKSLFEIFHDRGYSCSMFYSSYFDYTGFRDFLKNRGLDEMYDADTMPGQRSTERVAWGLLEEETLGAIRNQLKKYAQGHQRFCLTYVPAAPHYPYDRIPKPFQKHKMKEIADFTPLYLNELLYIDWVLASILDELKQTGLLDNTLVVITNDHGEMLGGKDGHIGHGWAVTPELANTPLILLDPGHPGLRVNKTIGTQVDLLPTILDRLNIPVPANELYEGLSLDAGEARAERFGYLNSYKEFGIISGDQVLLGDRESETPSGVASKGAVYRISNEGVKTVFTEETGDDLQPGDKVDPSAAIKTDAARGASRSLATNSGQDVGRVRMATGTLRDREKTMGRFDAFQENLLQNYSAYREYLRGEVLAQANHLGTSQDLNPHVAQSRRPKPD